MKNESRVVIHNIYALITAVSVLVISAAVSYSVINSRILDQELTLFDYNLESDNIALSIVDELHILQHELKENFNVEQNTFNKTFNDAAYLISELTNKLSAIQKSYDDPKYEFLIQKIITQKNNLLENIRVGADNSKLILTDISGFIVYAHQFSRLHKIEFERTRAELNQLKSTVDWLLIPVAVFLLTVSLLFIRKVLNQSKNLITKILDAEFRLKLVLEGASLGFWDWNLITNESIKNEMHAKIFGYKYNEEKFEFQDWKNIIHDTYRARTLKALKNHLENKTPEYNFIYKTVGNNGESKWVSDFGKVVQYDENNKPIRMTGVVRDITNIIHDEIKLKESNEQLKLLIESTNDMITMHDKNGNYLFYRGPENSPVKEEELLGKSPSDFFDKKSAKRIIDSIKNAYETGVSTEFESLLDWDGGKVWFSEYIYPIKDSQGNINSVAKICHNINDNKLKELEKKELESQLIQSQKMESMGRLAGGIAHDFNNIISGIQGCAELTKYRFPHLDCEIKEAFDTILKGTKSAKNLSQQLLGFAREGKYNPVPLNINVVIENTISFTKIMLQRKVDFQLKLNNDIRNIEADAHQIEQVFTNLFINAKDAMPEGGEIMITTENKFVNAHENPGNYVRIKVSDTGAGIPEDIKNKIFDPFFTTKGEGKGTGLGLSTVYGIVKNHNGFVNVISEPGIGTTFIIDLPGTNATASNIVKEKANIVTGNLKVLIVDDEPLVRNICDAILGELGHSCLVASNGAEAIKLYKENLDEIDLVLLDIIMPGMDGKRTFVELKKLNKDVQVVLVSGYSKDSEAKAILDMGASGFIQKPFSISDLSMALNKN